ncbi:MAG TPA: hypothetical protein DDX92_04295 [Flavobacteriales bacterium]|jgi:glycosidase|nr:hypothetical protein [Flavobacteriales bacterium]
MNEVQDLLRRIYGRKEAQILESKINALVDHWSEKVHNASAPLNEKDVVLITYADQLQGPEETPLRYLNHWLKTEWNDLITAVHLLPFYPYSSDDGFSVIDYKKVDPNCGSWIDIQELSNDYRLIFDAVINHISKESLWFSNYLNEKPGFENYFIPFNPDFNSSKVVRPRTSPLFHKHASCDGFKKVWTTFSEDQIDLNFKNPEVLIRILDVLMFYLSQGANILRLDAVGFMWKESGTSCIHLTQTHLLIKLMKLILHRLNPSVLLLTETNVPHQENISYFGNNDEADMVYNFTLPPLLAYSLLTQQIDPLCTWLKNLEIPFKDVCYFNFLASHDGIGVRPLDGILHENQIDVLLQAALANGGKVSYKKNPDGSETPYEINSNYLSILFGVEGSSETAVKRFLLAHAFLLAMPGLPAIYLHSLIGSENDIRGMIDSGIPRRINRQKLNFESLTKELADESSQRYKLTQSIKELMEIRKKEPAFNPYASFDVQCIQPELLKIRRKHEAKDQEVICFFHFGEGKTNLNLGANKTYTNLKTGRTVKGELPFGPYAFEWLKKG